LEKYKTKSPGTKIMKSIPMKVIVRKSEVASWNTVWKWWWFIKDSWIDKAWEDNKTALKPLFPLLSKWRVKSILDCSCGLGLKSILFANKGYDVEGSDASTNAIKYAPELSKEKGVDIRFFHSRYAKLNKKCKRKYDCVWSDNFDELRSQRLLTTSSKGIYSVLKKGGRFVFYGALPEWTKKDLRDIIEKEWQKRKKFQFNPTFERDTAKVINIENAEKTSEGILENQIFLIEKNGNMRAEIASIMNPRIKWTFNNYVDILKGVGFSKVQCIKREGQIFNIAIK
jgi:SAM-dependent methyltransferase